jgi:hypothetical protein
MTNEHEVRTTAEQFNAAVHGDLAYVVALFSALIR